MSHCKAIMKWHIFSISFQMNGLVVFVESEAMTACVTLLGQICWITNNNVFSCPDAVKFGRICFTKPSVSICLKYLIKIIILLLSFNQMCYEYDIWQPMAENFSCLSGLRAQSFTAVCGQPLGSAEKELNFLCRSGKLLMNCYSSP